MKNQKRPRIKRYYTWHDIDQAITHGATSLRTVFNRYHALKDRLFEGSSFAVVDHKSTAWKEYNAAFQYFNPVFRKGAQL